MHLKLASRSSDLARIQAYTVGRRLQKILPDLKIEFQFRESLGDKNLTDALWKMPEKGVFTEDFLQDLIDKKTDLVVHSWKDLPTETRKHTLIAATLEREDQRDLLLFKKSSMQRCRTQKKVNLFTSSLRRQYNLQGFLQEHLPFAKPFIEFSNIRGNIPTRLRKLFQNADCDGLILAKAAWDRILSAEEPEFAALKRELQNFLPELHWMILPLSENPNAAAQGALAIEIHKDRQDLWDLLQKINDPQAFRAVMAERDCLASYGGGCHQKIGISIQPRSYGNVLHLRGLTDAGEILAQHKIEKSQTTLLPIERWSSRKLNTLFNRISLNKEIPPDTKAVFVAKFDAWKDFDGYVWSSGLSTWKKLAAKGVWVNGSSEGLGESENKSVQHLTPPRLDWLCLTHEAAAKEKKDSALGTYKLELKSPLSAAMKAEILSAKAYFWTSSFHYDLVASALPEIATRHHSCGPGNTALALQSRGLQIEIFLDERSWHEHK